MTVFMFPGQGSQARGMGGELFARYPEYTAAADEILGYSLAELCADDDRLQHTEYTQPALFVVNVLSYIDEVVRRGARPASFVGHSLGEYNALFAAGAFDFRTGVALVRRRGELMARLRGGGMAAILGLDIERVRAILRDAGFDAIDVANENAPRQVILSGQTDDLERVKPIFAAAGARFAALRVSGAFHSRYMAPARAEFAQTLAAAAIRDCHMQVIANVDARPFPPGGVRERLLDQLVRPVRFAASVRYLCDAGEREFIEVGPGRVLTNLVAQIRSDAR
jgi:trans-AT polyketide synthase, acyltransferase and oxidoreductase domains